MDFNSSHNLRTSQDIRDDLIPTFFPAPASIQSQYAASPVIVALVDSFALRILPDTDIVLFFNEIFNIYSARGWGLDNWGRILGIGRIIQVADDKIFGFAGSGLQPFNQGTFASKGVTKAYSLTDEAYRRLLLVKALVNISSADAATLNVILAQLFPGKTVYVLEVGIMAVRFVFEFFLKPFERAIFQVPGLLTRGAGVGAELLEVPRESTFGFAGSGLQPFNQGTFLRSGPIPVR